MKPIPTPDITIVHGMNKMNSSIYLNHEPIYVNQPSYNANQSKVETNNYAELQNTEWTKKDYHRLQG